MQSGVHKGAVNLDELSFLLSQRFIIYRNICLLVSLKQQTIMLRIFHSCPDYWKKRLRTERIERVQQAKEHWESQCRSLMGIWYTFISNSLVICFISGQISLFCNYSKLLSVLYVKSSYLYWDAMQLNKC